MFSVNISMTKDIQYILFGIVSIILSNIVLMYMCPIFDCYQFSFINIFKGSLICNACTNMTYNIQKYQIQIYFAIGSFIIKKMNDFINSLIKTT